MEDRPLKLVVREILDSFSQLFRSEIRLAKAEASQSVRSAGKQFTKLGIFAAIGVFGALSFLAFAVVGLGVLLGNFWLSALIIGVLLTVSATIGISTAIGNLKRSAQLNELRLNLERDRELISRKWAEVKESPRTQFVNTAENAVPEPSLAIERPGDTPAVQEKAS